MWQIISGRCSQKLKFFSRNEVAKTKKKKQKKNIKRNLAMGRILIRCLWIACGVAGKFFPRENFLLLISWSCLEFPSFLAALEKEERKSTTTTANNMLTVIHGITTLFPYPLNFFFFSLSFLSVIFFSHSTFPRTPV